ncbi:MAG TPA: hypothetical protein VJ949_06655 [Cryomorphaceae bacterium]|nr:hypothetical protein [Cryomorphaceae bacterium]
MLRGILILIICALGGASHSQVYILPFDRLSQLRQDRIGLGTQPSVHSGAMPILLSDAKVSQLPGFAEDTAEYYYKITEKIFSEHLLELDKPDFKIYADVLFDFGFGRETVDQISSLREENSLFQNTRGFVVQGEIGKNVYFYTDFRENQGRYAAYINGFVDSTQVFPGSGRIKPFGEGGYDYSMAGGFVGIEAAEWLDLSFGHFKQFIGHGYRSLFLSDNAHNYPFASYEIDALEGKLQHRYTLALLQNLDRLPQGETPEAIFKRKVASWNYLSYKPLPNLELGLFEEVIWKIFDDSLGSQPFDYRALIPFPGINSALLGLDDEENNARIGFNAAWFVIPTVKVYGQLLSNSSKLNLDGFQIGSRWSGILDRLDIQVEYNHASNSATRNPDDLQSAYHFNQPLGHVLGRDFSETIGIITYYHKRIFAQLKSVYIRSNVEDELSSDHISSNLSNTDIQLGYVFNPSCNFQVYTGYTYRNESVSNDERVSGFWYMGIRTALSNIYRDF